MGRTRKLAAQEVFITEFDVRHRIVKNAVAFS